MSWGRMQLSGQGVPKNALTAFDLFKRAVSHGNAVAQYHVGYCLADGVGTDRNLPEAVVWWYKRSAQQNNAGCSGGTGALL